MNFTAIYLPFLLILSTFFASEPIKSSLSVEVILENHVDTLLATSNLNGLSIGIYQDGKTYKLHKGQLIMGANSLPNDETLYEIASLTKTFAGTLLAQAIVEGKVNIQDDIRQYLDGDFPNLSYEGQPITFAHLVTHNSRLPFLFPHTPDLFEESDNEKIVTRINALTQNLSKETFLAELAKYQLDTLPGSGFSYSNAGANLLGYCLENIYQKDFEELLKSFITNSLEMNNTYVQLPLEKQVLLASGYSEEGKLMPFFAKKDMNADGGIKSTLPDMLKYMAFHLNEKNPVAKQAHEELLGGKFGAFENALFWQMFKSENGERKIFQNGGAPGTSSWMTFIPEQNFGVFVVTNTAGPNVHQQLNELTEKVMGDVLR